MTKYLIFPNTGIKLCNSSIHTLYIMCLLISYGMPVHYIRENRLRHYLGGRYDSRSGVYDWDYHMKLKEMVSKMIMFA